MWKTDQLARPIIKNQPATLSLSHACELIIYIFDKVD